MNGSSDKKNNKVLLEEISKNLSQMKSDTKQIKADIIYIKKILKINDKLKTLKELEDMHTELQKDKVTGGWGFW